MPEASRFGPVLALDVIHNRTFFPRQQSRDHETDAFTASRRSEREDVFRPVVPQVPEARGSVSAPSTDINTALCFEKTGFADVLLTGPAGGPVQILAVLH